MAEASKPIHPLVSLNMDPIKYICGFSYRGLVKKCRDLHHAHLHRDHMLNIRTCPVQSYSFHYCVMIFKGTSDVHVIHMIHNTTLFLTSVKCYFINTAFYSQNLVFC